MLAFAHSGRTDSNGGHYDRSDGSYHYHHGYSAHRHPNGVCPFDFDDAEQPSNSSNNATDETSNVDIDDIEEETSIFVDYIVPIILLLLFGIPCLIGLFEMAVYFFDEFNECDFSPKKKAVLTSFAFLVNLIVGIVGTYFLYCKKGGFSFGFNYLAPTTIPGNLLCYLLIGVLVSVIISGVSFLLSMFFGEIIGRKSKSEFDRTMAPESEFCCGISLKISVLTGVVLTLIAMFL